MAAELGILGVPVTFHTTVPDTLEAGIEAFRLAASRAIRLASGCTPSTLREERRQTGSGVPWGG
jgi:hypothetical protein